MEDIMSASQIGNSKLDVNPPQDHEYKPGICPSKSTVYVGNISYSLTNNDLAKMLEHCGTIVCTKIAKDKNTRRSRGYAFVQFLKEEDANNCVQEYDKTKVFGRTWSCSIAKDNGRTGEFIRKRTYPDKSRCYECGEFGHLSYKCSKNALGEREPPRRKKRRKYNKDKGCSSHNSTVDGESESDSSSDERDTRDDPKVDSLGAAINDQREKIEKEDYRDSVISGNYEVPDTANVPKRRKFVTDEYFSDEEVLADEDE